MTHAIITSKLHLAWLLLAFSGCSASLNDYRGTTPEFVMEKFLSGKLTARGMVQDYTGQVTRRFCVDIDGRWQETDEGLQGTIEETFHYNDGEKSVRVWQVQKQSQIGDPFYTGTAGDVVGTATGQSIGYAFYWEYDLQLPIADDNGKETTYQFRIKDWIYQLDENHALNRSVLKKFGIAVGELTIFFDKTRPTCG